MFPVLIEEAVLQQRVADLATAIQQSGQEAPLHMVAVLEGARCFSEDLCAALGRPSGAYDTIRLASYGAERESSGRVELVEDLKTDVAGASVLIVEDIVDTGRTLAFLLELLRARAPASIRVCTLLSKPSRRIIDVPVDHIGFEIPDLFVIGYGMDLDGRHRDLPYIGTIEQEPTLRDSGSRP